MTAIIIIVSCLMAFSVAGFFLSLNFDARLRKIEERLGIEDEQT
jgi:uncharacterized protein YneF (UPF0154 family)